MIFITSFWKISRPFRARFIFILCNTMSQKYFCNFIKTWSLVWLMMRDETPSAILSDMSAATEPAARCVVGDRCAACDSGPRAAGSHPGRRAPVLTGQLIADMHETVPTPSTRCLVFWGRLPVSSQPPSKPYILVLSTMSALHHSNVRA